MRGTSFWFFLTATIYVALGMIWGIVMSVSGDHTLAPAHAHLNLIGWVTMALFGVYYHRMSGLLAKIGSVLTLTSMLLFVTIVLRNRETSKGAGAELLSRAGFIARDRS